MNSILITFVNKINKLFLHFEVEMYVLVASRCGGLYVIYTPRGGCVNHIENDTE